MPSLVVGRGAVRLITVSAWGVAQAVSVPGWRRVLAPQRAVKAARLVRRLRHRAKAQPMPGRNTAGPRRASAAPAGGARLRRAGWLRPP